VDCAVELVQPPTLVGGEIPTLPTAATFVHDSMYTPPKRSE
jgi:hypothetical protein